MENSDKTSLIFTIDEYGRANIEDKKLLELISGAGDSLESFIKGSCNNGCNSNGACANRAC